MPKRDYSITKNRELSWLQFDERVLDEATFPFVPLFERLKFVAIFTSNLDEFYMIRVGSLNDLLDIKSDHIDNKSGMDDKEQLKAIYALTNKLIIKKDIIYDNLKHELDYQGIHLLDINTIDRNQKKFLNRQFEQQIQPILSPMIIDSHHPFPHLQNKKLYIAVLLKLKNKMSLGIVGIPTSNRLIEIGENSFVFLEKLILYKCDSIFKADEILEKAIICVTRNGDIDVAPEILDQMDDYRDYMQNVIKKRKRLAPVRLEIQGNLSEKGKDILLKALDLKNYQLFESISPLDMSFVYGLSKKYEKKVPELFYKPYIAPFPKEYDQDDSIINQLLKKDMLLYYPYESVTTFLRLLKAAAEDERVVSIKITLYRLANPSKVIEYLCQAAENGKAVTVLIELKARFDEQNNIDWAQVLEENGCNVMYGFDEYKVHSKICLITLKTPHHIRHIVQIGTGNYNEKTAKLYTDLCLMSASAELAEDAHNFFDNMAQGILDGTYHNLLVAPNHLKDQIIKMIDEQIALKDNGYIFMKMNSLSDIDIIDKFVEASQANVKIELVIRGICCLVPGIPQKTDNITIRSIVGRYLEHARIYVFGKRGSDKIYIASADMMTRNTENRVEVAAPIYNSNLKEKIYEIIDISLKDNVGARLLGNDGQYHHIHDQNNNINSQEELMRWAMENADRKLKKRKPLWKKVTKIIKQFSKNH